MGFLKSTFDLSCHADGPQEPLAIGLLLQEQVVTRISILALHTARYPENRELFLHMVRDVVAVLMSTEALMLPGEGLDAIEAFLEDKDWLDYVEESTIKQSLN